MTSTSLIGHLHRRMARSRGGGGPVVRVRDDATTAPRPGRDHEGRR
ncbi:MAG: hypothetical protein MUF83_17265 [Acidimicrobiales bacterium]|nr:hypothetical protein [Acidimicrobiales bacterium]